MQRLRIGTRGSRLALAQAAEACVRLGAALSAALGLSRDEAKVLFETVIIKTSGDVITDRALSDEGGKGLFVKEIEEALIDGRIDIAVHSLKDLPARLPGGLALASVLPREDVRDALIGAASIDGLKPNAVVGTSSPRRKAQLLSLRRDLSFVLFRGNVDTRIAKLARGEADVTLLAMAGLKRIGAVIAASPLDVDQFLPAACQGAIGLEIRGGDEKTHAIVARINDVPSALTVAAERGFLEAIGGSCKTPLAAHARREGDEFVLKAALFAQDGSAVISDRQVLSGALTMASATALGRALGRDILKRAPSGFRVD